MLDNTHTESVNAGGPRSGRLLRGWGFRGLLAGIGLVWALGAETAAEVSWTRDVQPILQRSCNGCHRPDKARGGVDTTTWAALLRGGKEGPVLIPGDPDQSRLVHEISGAAPSMPEDGPPLASHEIEQIMAWIRAGAPDDTPETPLGRPAEAPRYFARPAITALAVSPDGHWLAVSGNGEVFLQNRQETGPALRLVGGAPRIAALGFSPDSRSLVVAGGAPGRFGELQVWPVPGDQPRWILRLTSDVLPSVAWSRDGTQIAAGAVDATVRVLSAERGEEQWQIEAHTDWVTGVTWSDGTAPLFSISRDRSLRRIPRESRETITDLNRLREPLLALARHPQSEQVAVGGMDGVVRVYRMDGAPDAVPGEKEELLVREYPAVPGGILSLVWSPDGSRLAAAGAAGTIHLFNTATGSREAEIAAEPRGVFAVVFAADSGEILAGGFDGLLRRFEVADAALVGVEDPIPADAWRSDVVRR